MIDQITQINLKEPIIDNVIFKILNNKYLFYVYLMEVIKYISKFNLKLKFYLLLEYQSFHTLVATL